MILSVSFGQTFSFLKDVLSLFSHCLATSAFVWCFQQLFGLEGKHLPWNLRNSVCLYYLSGEKYFVVLCVCVNLIKIKLEPNTEALMLW